MKKSFRTFHRMAGRLLGGREAASWATIVLYALPSFWVTLLFDRSRLDGGWIEWVVLAFAAYVATVAPIILARYTVLRPSARVAKPFTALGFYVLASITRAVAIVLIGSLTGIMPERELTQIVATTPVHVIVWFVIISRGWEAIARHGRAVRALDRARGILEEGAAAISAVVEHQREEAVTTIRRELSPALELIRGVSRSGLSRRSVDALVTQLSKTIDNVVRPLSEKLISSRESSDLTSHSRQSQRTLANFFPARVTVATANAPITIALLTVYCALLPGVRAYGWLAVLMILIPTACFIVACGALLTRVTGYRQFALAGVATLLFFTYGLAGALGTTLAQTAAPAIPVNVSIQVGVIIITIAIVLAIYRLTLSGLHQVEAELREANLDLARKNAELRQRLWVERSALATTLHGPVQAAFQVAAMRIASARNLTVDELRDLENHITEAVAQLASPETISRAAFEDAIMHIESIWGSIASVSIQADVRFVASIDEYPGTGRCVLEIVREAVMNAIKHGDARHIRVNVSRQGLNALVVATNDGHESSSVRPGLGHRLLDELCLTWDLSQGPTETTLTACVPLTRSAFG